MQAGLGLLLAVLVNQKLRGVTFFRIVFFIPVVTSIVVVSILWKFMYQQNGLINSMIDTVTFGALAGRRLAEQPEHRAAARSSCCRSGRPSAST